MERRTIETVTGLFLRGNLFIPEDWEFDLPSMYFVHKTKRFIDEAGGKGGKMTEVPYMLSARSVHRMMSAKV